jgi:hypothetical protein
MESGGNPNAHASTSKEDSRGLFQINLKAHPQWKNVNLYDPVENARLAADNFLSPALYRAGNAGLTSEGDITAYVWKNGIRPAWTEQKNQSIRQKVADFLKNGAGSLGVSSGAQPGATTGAQDTGNFITNTASDIINNLIDRFKAYSWNLVPLLLGLVILILVLYKMFATGSETINIQMGGKKK